MTVQQRRERERAERQELIVRAGRLPTDQQDHRSNLLIRHLLAGVLES